MIEQYAMVVDTRAGYAWVDINKDSKGCSGCQSGEGTCGVSLYSRLFNISPPKHFRVANNVFARSGDQVVVGLRANVLLIYSTLAYLLPLLSLLCFAILGGSVFSYLGFNSDLGACLAGATGLLAGLRFARQLSQHLHELDTFQPIILRKQNEHPVSLIDIPSSLHSA